MTKNQKLSYFLIVNYDYKIYSELSIKGTFCKSSVVETTCGI